ncbi:Flp pilus assembly protein CpaB, partial [bacterium]|nr:Flp pilus assembly protein CpaB [bacterium]
MNTRALTLALIISFLAMFMTQTYIDTREADLINKYGKLITVIVAKEDIHELELIDDRKVSFMTIPQNYVAPGSFRKKEEVANTVATVPIKKGEQITKPRLTFPGQSTGLSRQVAIGKRAMAMTVT